MRMDNSKKRNVHKLIFLIPAWGFAIRSFFISQFTARIAHRRWVGDDLILTERQSDILKSVVEHYLEYGEPIGSKTIVEMGFNLSSATIRSEMSDLELVGLLEQPHTSAGRIPSHKGLRYYIDNLMSREILSKDEQCAIDALLYEAVGSYDELLKNASAALANITELAAISTTLCYEELYLKRVEIIPTGRRTALIVLVTSNAQVKSKQCRMNVDLSHELLTVVSKMLNDKTENMLVSNITPEFMHKLAASFGDFAFIFTSVFLVMLEIVEELKNTEVAFEGQMNLLINSSYEGHQLKDLMEFFGKRDLLNNILKKQNSSVSVVIGTEESKAHQLDGTSMIVAKYKVGGKEAGTIGLIGPTRIDYKKMIPRLEYFADEIGKLITESIDEEDIE